MRGSCLCGAVRYELASGILGTNYCHCRQCRKASGTAFATNAAVERQALRIVQGEDNLRAFESSPHKHRYFCSTCGSPIYSHSNQTPERVYARIGTLDDEWVTPDVHIHVASKAPWYEIHDDLPQHREEEGLWF